MKLIICPGRLFNKKCDFIDWMILILVCLMLQRIRKLSILYGFYNDGNVRMSVTEDKVVESWKIFFNLGTN